VIFILPETKPKEEFPFQWSRINPFMSFYLLLHNKLTVGLCAIYFVMYLAEEGLIDTITIFFEYHFLFNPLQIAIVLAVIGVCFVLVQGPVIRFVMPILGERKTVLASLLVDMCSGWVYPVIPAKMYYILYPLSIFRSFALLAGPAIQGMISKHYSREKQGELMGVLSGLKTLTAFIGPLSFNNLFSFYISDNAWPFQIPGIIFYVATGMWIICFLMAVILFSTVSEPREVEFSTTINSRIPSIVQPLLSDEDEEEYYPHPEKFRSLTPQSDDFHQYEDLRNKLRQSI